ncbi:MULTISPECIES: hypothetical protein [Xanthobacter]|uniref:Uncharacterized protein n=1 Tax=Xanthobacter aminoxidans TaxID=186280 RepID=A0ABW6ZCY6_9HYPH|nr:hypothetical protein [Xanthobacter sp. 91]
MSAIDAKTLFAASFMNGLALVGDKPRFFRQGIDLTPNVRVEFDAQPGRESGILISRKSFNGNVFIEIEPRKLEDANWLTIEITLDIDDVRETSTFVSILDAFSVKSVSVFSVLRVTYPDGRWVDFSSAELEFNATSTTHAFPVVLSQKIQDALAGASGAKLIFFIESRSTVFGISEVRTIGILRDAKLLAMRASSDLLTQLENRTLEGAHRAELSTEALTIDAATRREVACYAEVAPNVCFSFGPAAEEAVALLKMDDNIVVDLTGCADSDWRTIEFLFHPTSVGACRGLLIDIQSSYLPQPSEAILEGVFRIFVEDGYQDISLGGIAIDTNGTRTQQAYPLDLTAFQSNRCRLILFVPPTYASLLFKSLAVTLLQVK